MNDISFIAKRVYELRCKRNISSRKLSLELGLSNSYITQIENGHKIPSIENLINICNYFDITLAQFFSTMEDNSLSPELEDIIQYARTLSQEELKIILQIIKKFKSK